MNRYLVISADTHAGLPGPEYRGWLDPEYREQFDDVPRRAGAGGGAGQGRIRQRGVRQDLA